MTLALAVLLLTVFFAIVFDLTNGLNDAANAIATVVSTRVLSPMHAVVFGAALNFVGALFSSKVATVVGKDIADPEFLRNSGAVFLAAVMTAPFWIGFCASRGLPNSCSHALLGALVGAVLAGKGASGLKSSGIQHILFGVAIAPIASFVLGNVLVRIVRRLAQRARPVRATWLFGKLQLLSAGAMAFAHGTGDAQKAMGIISGALVTYYAAIGQTMEFHIPMWVRLTAATAMAVGTMLGGWRVMRTLGSRLAHLRTYQGFAAETAAATTILVNTVVKGVPLSTTHSITGAILGVGAANGIKAVRWGVGKKIVYAWVFTFPVCILAGAAVYKLLRLVGVH